MSSLVVVTVNNLFNRPIVYWHWHWQRVFVVINCVKCPCNIFNVKCHYNLCFHNNSCSVITYKFPYSIINLDFTFQWVITYFVWNVIAMATGVGVCKIWLTLFDSITTKTNVKDLEDISYTSRVIAVFVSNFVNHMLELGLPTVPYFPGRPVFQPLCPASRLESSRDARCPVFWPLHSFCFEYVYSYWIPVQSKSVWPQQLVTSRSYDEFWETLKRLSHCFCSAFCPRKQCIERIFSLMNAKDSREVR